MHRAHFEGSLKPAQLSRLRGLLAGDEGDVGAVVSCGIDEMGRTVLAVSVDARVSVRCQRCLDVFKRPVAASSRLAVVETDEQAAGLPEGLEPVLATNEIDLWAVVEDELVLAMPVYSYHEDERCIEQLAGAAFAPGAGADEQRQSSESDGPFDVLAQLKRDLNH
ncbi:MAG: YceD family protein [Chromatocurvus sp.]